MKGTQSSFSSIRYSLVRGTSIQTDDELTEKEATQVEADDQAIQTILMGLPEDIYVVVDNCTTAQEIWLRVQQMMRGSDIGVQEKRAKLFNEWERFNSTKGNRLNLTIIMQMVRGNGRNQFSQYARQNVGNQIGYNAVQNAGNQVVHNVVQNLSIHNVMELNSKAKEKGFVVANCEKIEEVNVNCILMANLQQASTSEEHYINLLDSTTEPSLVQRDEHFWRKISLEVGTEKIIFNANEGATLWSVSPVCVFNDYDVIDDLGGPEDLEELLINDEINKDLGDSL
ncbi:hypothetical protein Tco_0092113 [Tanacetum coccineum]